MSDIYALYEKGYKPLTTVSGRQSVNPNRPSTALPDLSKVDTGKVSPLNNNWQSQLQRSASSTGATQTATLPKVATPVAQPLPTAPTAPSFPTVAGLAPFVSSVLGAVLTKPVGDVGEKFGELANNNPITDPLLESTINTFNPYLLPTIDKAQELLELKQREAQAIDNARVNNAPVPKITLPSTNGGGVVGAQYTVVLKATYTLGRTLYIPRNLGFGVNDRQGIIAYGNAQPAFIGAISGFTLTENASSYFVDFTPNGGRIEFGKLQGGEGEVIRSSIAISDIIRRGGLPDVVPPPIVTYDQQPSTPPPYPSRDNWEYGQVPVTVGGANPVLQPSVKPLQPSNVLPFAEPDDAPDINQPDTSSNPPIAKSPSGFTALPSSENPNNQSPTSTPTTGSTNPRRESVPVGGFTSIPATQTPATQIYANGMTNEAYNAGLKPNFNVVKQTDTPYSTGSQVTPNRPNQPVDSRPLNTTPTTPTTSNQNDSNFGQTIASILGLTALVTALKIGSDAFVNASLPKINTIEANTTPTAQQTNAKQGVCDAMQPNQCGFEGVKQATTEATQPIKDQTVANAGLLANILSAIANLASNVTGIVTRILNNQFVHSAMNALTLFTVLHNAAMLSRDIGETLGETVDNGLNLLGLRLKDSEGNSQDFTEFIGTNVRATIANIIGADNYAQLTLKWQKASAIFNSAANVLNTTQSMIDPLASAVEYGMENVSKIGNSLAKDGVVSENAYPRMDETIRARNVNRFTRLTDTLEGAEDIASNLSNVTSDAVSIKDDFKQLREDKKALTDSATAFNTAKQDELTAIKATIPTITDISVAPAPDDD